MSPSTDAPEPQQCVDSPSPAPRAGGALAHRIRAQRSEVLAILNGYGLSNPRLFGSVARGEETPESDFDLLVVDLTADIGLFALARCQAELEDLLEVPVDLIPAADLKEGVACEVLREAIAL